MSDVNELRTRIELLEDDVHTLLNELELVRWLVMNLCVGRSVRVHDRYGKGEPYEGTIVKAEGKEFVVKTADGKENRTWADHVEFT